MKRLLIAGAGLLALSTLSPVPAKAEVAYPWCEVTTSQSNHRNCAFVSFEQCRATLSGDVGICRPNDVYIAQRRGFDAYAYAPGYRSNNWDSYAYAPGYRSNDWNSYAYAPDYRYGNAYGQDYRYGNFGGAAVGAGVGSSTIR